MSFEALVAVVGIVISSTTVILAIARNIAQAVSFAEQRRRLESLHVIEVVASADLHTLGSLVVRDLGGTSMPNYVRHEEVRTRFRNAFNSAREFIGDVPGSTSEEMVSPGREQSSAEDFRVSGGEELTRSARRALQDVAEGESWNALARMRRELETVLASLLDQPVVGPRRMAAGQMLAVAAKQGAIASESAASLRYALSVANRAVHGEEVTADSAVEAVLLIDRFVRSFADDGPRIASESS